MSSDFAVTLHTYSTLKVIFFMLRITRENCLIGLKIHFQIEIWEFWSRFQMGNRHFFQEVPGGLREISFKKKEEKIKKIKKTKWLTEDQYVTIGIPASGFQASLPTFL